MNSTVWTEMTFVRVLNELGALGFDTQTVFGVVTLTKKVELSTPAAIRTNHVDPEFTSVDLDVVGRRYSFRITAMPDGGVETAYVVRTPPSENGGL